MSSKLKWFSIDDAHLYFAAVGSVLIFVTRKTNSEELANNLKQRDFQGKSDYDDLSFAVLH